MTRILRLPGTVNRKDPANIRPVRIVHPAGELSGKLARYDVADFHSAAPPNVPSPRQAAAKTPAVDTQTTLPKKKFDALLANDNRFRATWERQRLDLTDQSASGYELALANATVAAGWTDDEIAALIREWRRKHGEKPGKGQRADYISRTIAKARAALSSHSSADPGPTKRLADAILRHEHFACDAGGRLYVFTNGAYRPHGKAAVKRAVKHLLNEWDMSKKWSVHRAGEVVEYIRVDVSELLPRPPVGTVNVANGLLDVTKRMLKPHDPAFLSPIQIPVIYDPSAQCPAWVKFAADTFPKDARDLPWELVAWLMRPCTSIQKAVLLLGEGSNGKSTFLAALTALIGKPNVAGLSLHKLETDKFATARLVGKLANVCPDLPSKHLTETSVFKALTGGDILSAERKYAESFEFSPFARLVFSANVPPHSTDASHAFFRRWLVVPFYRTFEPAEQVPRDVLDARLAEPQELSGVLNKALDVLPRLLKSGFTESQSMRDAWNEFRETTDPVAVWLDAHTVQGTDLMVAKRDLLKAYNATARAEQRPTMTGMGFGQALKRLQPSIREAQRTIAGAVTWVWRGLGLKEEASSRT